MLDALSNIGNSFINIDFTALIYIKQLFWILFSTKLLADLAKKMNFPSVVGSIVAGIIIGPMILKLVVLDGFIESLAAIGAIIIMFTAGMETDIENLKKCGKEAFLVALGGVVLPLVLGTIVIIFYFHGFNFNEIDRLSFFKYLFIGVILTATSVSITVESLKELGKLKTEVGNVILGAAIIDDIIGIIVLTIVLALSVGNVSVPIVLVKVSLFILFALIFGKNLNKIINNCMKKSKDLKKSDVILAFCLCLGLSYVSEVYFGVAYITGAYIAGLIYCNNIKKQDLDEKFLNIGYMFFSPIFFASIGLEMIITNMNSKIIWFTVIIIITAIISKVIGCFLGSKIMKRNSKDALRISIGMINRGEVALIIASKGVSEGLLDNKYIVTIILTVIITTIITPILLKISYSNENNKEKN